MSELNAGLYKVRIKEGAIVGQDFAAACWPMLPRPMEEYEPTPEMVFLGKRGEQFWTCTAPGFGLLSPEDRYGNGSLCVWGDDQIEILDWETPVTDCRRAAPVAAPLDAEGKDFAEMNLQPLPKESANIWYHRGLPNFDDTDALKALDDGTGKAIPLYTAEQVRQAQGEAVAADRRARDVPNPIERACEILSAFPHDLMSRPQQPALAASIGDDEHFHALIVAVMVAAKKFTPITQQAEKLDALIAYIDARRAAVSTTGDAPEGEPTCYCRVCNKDRLVHGMPYVMTTFIVCPTCGNKRCPKATDHALACTGSNEPEQVGSAYGTAAPQPPTEKA